MKMSVWNERFQTLNSNDLASQTLPSSGQGFQPTSGQAFRSESVSLVKEPGIEVIRAENSRLQEENRHLRQCLVSMRENASLRTAHVLASLLVWSDEQIAGQAKNFLTKDMLNNNDTKLSPAISPFRPISPGPIQQSKKQTPSIPPNQQASVLIPQNAQSTHGQPQLLIPNQPSNNVSDLTDHGNKDISNNPLETNMSAQHQTIEQRGEQNLKIPGSSQLQGSRPYSPRKYMDDVPSVFLIPDSPSQGRNSSHSPVPHSTSRNKSHVPRNRSPSRPYVSTGQPGTDERTLNGGNGESFKDKTSSPSFRNTVKSLTGKGGSSARKGSPNFRSTAQSLIDKNQTSFRKTSPGFRNTVQSYIDKGSLSSPTNIAERSSKQKYPDSASSFDDRLENLLSRQIVPGEYATEDTTGPGHYQSRFEMPGSSLNASDGDTCRRAAVSSNVNQTGSEGYGSVPSGLHHFGGDQSEHGIQSGSGAEQHRGEDQYKGNSASVGPGADQYRGNSVSVGPGADQYRGNSVSVGPGADQYRGNSASIGPGADQYRGNSASVARKVIGDPIATSTPARPGKAQTYTATSDVIHRPVDSVIGYKPVLSESLCQKLTKIRASKRLVGEVAFQLDRRILQYVFSETFVPEKERHKRYYGYSIPNMWEMIRKEALDERGNVNTKKEVAMTRRFEYIIKTLANFGYVLEKHAQFAQDMVNKHGLLNAPPDKQTVKAFGLEDPVILRVLLSKLLQNDVELQDELILLDCLCLLAYDDRKPLFRW
ncbi:uncharacterized protein [Argopecten irradians]|uniref:uncharacterized protein isoform X2 n=1 Tax=Argopecten irradians TaxID=31199 RepID=UPI0037247549